ncbi:hypothetical protein GGI15_002406 [Coemansia interrupta]|uniref:AB hydrolase-1 domain-containing protein n=1 Tax=Coemansia interrupta TaxID=1126814 RepID=A0A9W8LLE6_9FUNG|nr:hypothetical protein GGI15_002406 [Coemansia interrupta]
MSDKGLVSLDWYPQRPPLLKSTESSDSSIGSRTNAELKGVPIIIVVPGSMGSSSEYYIRHLAKTLSTYGPPDCRVVVLNHRGYARTPLLTTRFQSFAFTDDIHEVVQYLSETFPDSSLGAVGFSMGANMLTRYLGDQGGECKLSAAATICCPYNVAKLYETILRPTLFNNRVLQPNMTESAQKFIRRNKDVIQSGARQYDIDALLKAKNVEQIDKLLIAPISGYSSLEAYYAESSSGPVVSQIVTPLLAINSKDDPMVPVDAIPIDSFRSNPNTALVLTGHGGHLGFFSGIVPKIWYMDPLVQFFSALL